jgi:hypothetical protein
MWYFVDGYERKPPIYAAAEFLNNSLGGEKCFIGPEDHVEKT